MRTKALKLEPYKWIKSKKSNNPNEGSWWTFFIIFCRIIFKIWNNLNYLTDRPMPIGYNLSNKI
jgi:hypothetical protein